MLCDADEHKGRPLRLDGVASALRAASESCVVVRFLQPLAPFGSPRFCPAFAQLSHSTARENNVRSSLHLQSGHRGRAGLDASLRLLYSYEPRSARTGLAAAARFELRFRWRGEFWLCRAVDVRRGSLAAGLRVAKWLRVCRLLNRDASRGATPPTHRIRDFSPAPPCAFAY